MSSGMTCSITQAEGLITLHWLHAPTGRSLGLTFDSRGAMAPSVSTSLMLTHMKIRPGESVLDLGAGNGVLGLAALLLGAGQVWFSDIDPACVALIQANLSRFRQMTGIDTPVKLTQGSLFMPVGAQRFDHILVNPPSIPSPDESLSIAYRSGPEGRLFHDAIQALAGYYLNDGGRLSFVQGSLSNRPKSLAQLQDQGFSIEATEPQQLPLQDHYPLPWLLTLAEQGKADLIQMGSRWFETRGFIQATLPKARSTPVMQRLQDEGVVVRPLPHLRAALTVDEAASERGVAPEEMIKCILLKDRQSRFVLACLSGNAELDTQKVHLAISELSRLSFSTPDEINRVTGHTLGSVAPISLRDTIPVVFDQALRHLERINISSGDPRLGLELPLLQLLRVLGPVVRFAPIRKEGASAP